MRVSRGVPSLALVVSLSLLVPTAALAGRRRDKDKDGGGDSVPTKSEAKRQAKFGSVPGAPSGGPTGEPPSTPYPNVDTIRAYVNGAGQTVFSISPSQADLSPPLSQLAATATKQAQEEQEPSLNPQLPVWRTIRSETPDPVVQFLGQEVSSLSAGGGPALTPPTIGFNFLGVGINGGTPSDSNGSVGNNQFVEVVNTRYEVWNLNHSTHVATVATGPANINTLWSGFGGACQTQNSGDPIVLYDKVANRWLISQFTSSASAGVYYQCVAISTSSSATGTYNRYAFAVPNGDFGDYPHFGVWSDAYYMMAHAFTSASGSYVAAIFAAMDRTKMLAGDPTATWQVIFDPSEGGHMPADLDGFAPPPTGAPGIFLSWHTNGMYIYRMKVDFTTPANTNRTVQAIVPIAAATGACGGGGSCIPQPASSVTVGSLADRLMFRAAYRNYVDHETLMVSHSVDPSVSGVVSGVRWYDFRISGSPNATCSSFPCVYQQGTISDTANGRSRWMPSIAQDGAENVLVGYSATGTANLTDNQSIRYTGRNKNDAPGTMSVPEATIVTGTANNTNSRWGDYTSMSIDPFDDCTFWYVNQYFTSAGSWSTRIASSTFPAGSGPGQCSPLACTTRPAGAPTIGTATAPSDNKITVTWTPLVPTPGSYAIERATGACGSEGMYRPLAGVSAGASSYNDTTVLGGLTYSYRVIAAADGTARCQSQVVSDCVSATATGTCNLKPSFAGATVASSAGNSTCGVVVSWTPAQTSCPLTPTMRYSVFRGTTPDFVPSPANRIATCVTGPSSYVDHDNLASGTTYFYAVRSEDNSSGNGGECGGGNEDSNAIVVPGTPYGAGTSPTPGTWTDGGGDGTAFMQLNVAGAGDTSDTPWRYVKTANDAGANHTPGGAYAYRNAGPGASATYTPNVCAEMQAPALTAGASNVNLEFWERHQIEYHWDAVAIEYAVNGGPWLDAPAPSNDPGAGCDPGDDVTGWEPMECTQSPPINGCGYPTSKFVYNGPLGSGSTCNDYATAGTVTNYAHRCHPITGLHAGDSIRFRWRFSSDPGAEYAGFYLDDVAVTNVQLPNACIPDTCAGQIDGTPCNDGNPCTSGDVCSGGACQPGTTAPGPTEVTNVALAGAGTTTVTWDAISGATVYDVASQTLSDLHTNGTATAQCFANDVPGTSVNDARTPAPGDGYYYIIRGQNSCSTGTYGFDSSSVERVPVSACP